MESNLLKVKDFIIKTIDSKTKDKALITNMGLFLQRLIDKTEFTIDKNLVEIKAGRQLLCSIGIDLISNSVPVEHYLSIFNEIDFTNINIQARLMFINTIYEKKLYYRETEKKTLDCYCAFVFPIKDWYYYLQPRKTIGLVKNTNCKYVHTTVLTMVKKEKLHLEYDTLDKKGELRNFWLTTEDEIRNVLVKSTNPTYDIVDRLGLSHFDFLTTDTQVYFYLSLSCNSIETYKPNATVIDWNDPKVGFMSYPKNEFGKTFSITGSKYEGGISERVFVKHPHKLTEDEQKASLLKILKKPIENPIILNPTALIIEGINRFNKK